MKILSANLLNGRADTAAVGALLDRVLPDIFIGVEVGTNLDGLLVDRLPFGEVNASDDFLGRALVAREPIRVERWEVPNRPGSVATIRLRGVAVKLFAVHLANPLDGFGQRRRQLKAILGDLEGNDPCVLVGDLNSTPTWPAYRHLCGSLDDLVLRAAAREGRRPSRTWGPTDRWPALLRIDHVLGRGIDAIRPRVHHVAGSDHRAVEVTLVPTW